MRDGDRSLSAYEIDGEAYEGVLVYDGSVDGQRPGC